MTARVEELTGLYGPVFLEEKQVQRIWASRTFRQADMVTRSGRRLEILDPGRWNFQEGPDFRGAILEMDGVRVHGDIEIHLHEEDWWKHKHGSDPNFANVILHVVLFPKRQKGQSDLPVPSFETLEWLKYLDQDLESYLEDHGSEDLLDKGLPQKLAPLASLPIEARETVLLEAAWERWSRKCEVAERRLLATSWTDACHQVFLEVLGLRRNRAPMSVVAATFPLEQWSQDPESTANEAYASMGGQWKLAGLRPANHPRRRLLNYGAWIEKRGVAWPTDLESRTNLPRATWTKGTPLRVSSKRKGWKLRETEENLRSFFTPGVGGSRFHNWITDGFLPLLAEKKGQSQFPIWYAWPCGDAPDHLKEALQTLSLTGRGRPLCNGLIQGAFRVLEPDYRKP
ncbi:MAG: DUF2851 family protein [Verrucomicrobiota bacterium]